ncbi:transposase domain-containing protein [Sinorhizobium meliloti]|uniref:transposase domain-containing protein n=1 Tax=Rhizobium meliloti TaxID=382 RepID=UPI003B52CBBC
MSNASQNLPDDPAFLKAMIAASQAENAKMSATLQAHDQLIGELRLRIAKLKKQVFGKSSEKIERSDALASIFFSTAAIRHIPCDLGDTRYTNCLIGAIDPVEGASTIRNQEPCGRSLRMPFAQIAFVADDRFDVLGSKIDTASQLSQLWIGRASKTRIDFDDNRATLCPPEFNVRWSRRERVNSSAKHR